MHGRGTTAANGPDLGGLDLDRHTATATLGDDAPEDHDLIADVKEAVRFVSPFAPRFSKPGDDLRSVLSPLKYRFALGIVGWQPNLELLVEVVAEHLIDPLSLILGICVAQIREEQ